MSAYDFIEKRFSDLNIGLDDIIKLMEDYSTICINASLEKASEKSKTKVISEFEVIIDKESITNPENIILL
jgi:hypothetical protein